MNTEKYLPSSQREFERGFGWTLLLSAAAHAALIAAIIMAPGFVLRPQPPLKSYSVELVDASKLGGTNMIAGGKGKAADVPKVEPAKAKPEEAAKEQPEPPKQEAKREPMPAKPPEPPKPEQAKPEPPKEDEKAVAIAVPTPTRPQEVAKVEMPTAVKVAPTVAEIAPTVAKVEPTKASPTMAKAQATATSPPKAVVKVQPTKAPVKVAAKVQPTPTVPAKSVAKGQPTPAKSTAHAKVEAKSAEAAKTPPAEAKNGGASSARDERIAAAIKRIEQQAGTRGGGAGNGASATPGAPIALGPGEGMGGELRSVAFIMYSNRLEAMIKAKWAWAGANRALKADIGFNILPTGEVSNVHTVASSGDATYDKLAETAVRAASPFPPPPEDYQSEFADKGFVYTFEPE